MKRLCSLTIFLTLTLGVWAQKVVSSIIVDAVTGEALPWVHVITDEKDGTVTNTDGEFELKISTQKTIHISTLGYEKTSFPVSHIPNPVRLNPISYGINEVKVTPIDAKRLIGDLYDKYIKWVVTDSLQQNATYFYRQTTRNNGKINEILEAFFNTSSSIMINDFNLCYGRYASTDTDISHRNFFSFSAITPLGKMGKDGALWTAFITKEYENYYDVDLKSFALDGRDAYILTFSEKKRNKLPVIVGKLYVDGYSLLPIKFEGEILHFNYHQPWQMSGQKPSFTITYSSYEDKVKVESVSFKDSYNIKSIMRDSEKTKVEISSIMYRVRTNLPEAGNTHIRTSDYLYEAIKSHPYDSAFWAKYPIIKRTEKEIQAIDNFSKEFIENSASLQLTK